MLERINEEPSKQRIAEIRNGLEALMLAVANYLTRQLRPRRFDSERFEHLQRAASYRPTFTLAELEPRIFREGAREISGSAGRGWSGASGSDPGICREDSPHVSIAELKRKYPERYPEPVFTIKKCYSFTDCRNAPECAIRCRLARGCPETGGCYGA